MRQRRRRATPRPAVAAEADAKRQMSRGPRRRRRWRWRRGPRSVIPALTCGWWAAAEPVKRPTADPHATRLRRVVDFSFSLQASQWTANPVRESAGTPPSGISQVGRVWCWCWNVKTRLFFFFASRSCFRSSIFARHLVEKKWEKNTFENQATPHRAHVASTRFFFENKRASYRLDAGLPKSTNQRAVLALKP